MGPLFVTFFSTAEAEANDIRFDARGAAVGAFFFTSTTRAEASLLFEFLFDVRGVAVGALFVTFFKARGGAAGVYFGIIFGEP